MSLTTRGRFILNYLVNFLSAILLIYLSKWIFRQYPIPSLTLTIFNCFFSGLFATITLKFLSKPSTTISISTNRWKAFCRLIILSGACSMFIIFSNLSLQYNTLGTYQLIKLQIPPVLMLIEWIQLRLKINSSLLTEEKFYRDYSYNVLFAFSIIVLGTLVNTYSDLYFYPLGITYACISVVCNGLFQAFIQGDKSLTIYERIRFLQIQSITSGFLLCPGLPFIEPSLNSMWNLYLQWDVFSLICLCGILAFLVNSSVIWCIKDDAAIGYNMVGQLKTLFIVFIGSAIFGEILTIKQVISILFTTLGCVYYVYSTYKTKQRQKSQEHSLINNNNSDDRFSNNHI